MTATRPLKNNMGDGYTVAKDEKGRTVYTSADGLFVVRATGAKWLNGASWCVEHAGIRRYALSLGDARGVIGRWRATDQYEANAAAL